MMERVTKSTVQTTFDPFSELQSKATVTTAPQLAGTTVAGLKKPKVKKLIKTSSMFDERKP